MNSITRAFWAWWSPLMEWWRCVETKNEKIQVKSFPISLQIVCTLTHTSHKSLWEWEINNWQVFGDTLSRTAMMEGINVKKVIFLVPLFPCHSQRDLWDLCGGAHTIWSEMGNYFTWFFLFFLFHHLSITVKNARVMEFINGAHHQCDFPLSTTHTARMTLAKFQQRAREMQFSPKFKLAIKDCQDTFF